MKNKTIPLILSCLALTGLVYSKERGMSTEQPAKQDPASQQSSRLADQSFVVESSDTDLDDSLNRISGNIDLGFSSPDQSYQSEDQTKAGPFGRQELSDSKETHY